MFVTTKRKYKNGESERETGWLEMTLKSARLGRAEDLDADTRAKYGLPEHGLIVIQTTNPELKDEMISIEEDGGFRGYLLKFGDLREADIAED
jgi:hypothetical protein